MVISHLSRLIIIRLEISAIPLFLSPTQSINNNGTPEHLLLEPEVLHVLAPPFVSRQQAESETVRSHGKRRRSFLRKKREKPPSAAATPSQGVVLPSTWRVHLRGAANMMFPSRFLICSVILPMLSLEI